MREADAIRVFRGRRGDQGMQSAWRVWGGRAGQRDSDERSAMNIFSKHYGPYYFAFRYYGYYPRFWLDFL